MIVAWLLFPLVVLAACLGCGLLVEWLAGWELPGTILVSLGLALIMVVATLTTDSATTAPVTTPLVIVLALAGLGLGRGRLRALRPDGWAVGVAVGVFCVCAAPVVASGSASFLGYFVLNDAIFHFALINQLLSHGHDISHLPLSSYQAVLNSYLTTSYPTGADLPIGVLRPLVGEDVAWIFQPYMAMIVALGGAAVYELLRETVAYRPLRAVAAFISAQAGMLFAYYLQASIKEVATTWIITVTIVLVFATLARGMRLRGLLPLVVATFAGLDLLDLAIAPWLALPLVVFIVIAGWRVRHVVRRQSRRRLILGVGGAVIVLAAVAVPVIQRASTFLSVATAILTQKGDLGNLLSPVSKWEMTGIWPIGDFRLPAAHQHLAFVLIGVELVSAVFGTLWAIRTRRYAPLVLLVGNGIAAAYLLHRGSPYADAKVMMVFSLTAVATAMLGPAAFYDSGRRIEAWGIAAAIAAGVLWTNALGYHDASVAPRARLQELASIGQRFSGEGPSFYNLADEFAAYFLRQTAPTDTSLSPAAPRPGIAAPPGRAPWDLDDLPLTTVESFRLLVLGNAALTSRPPANYRLAYQGRYYDVWERTRSPTVLSHLPLGGTLYPASIPRCSLVRSTAAQAAREHARLAYVVRPPSPAMVPTKAARPATWVAVDPFTVTLDGGAGMASAHVQTPQAGEYQVSVEGDISQRLRVLVDGRQVGTVAYQLGPPGQITPVGTISLAAGVHTVAVARPGANLSPGDGGLGRSLGPVLLVRGPTVPAVSEIAPAQARSLCGQSLDWIEIVR